MAGRIIDINRIPLNDPGTFKLLRRCQTTAIFQLESRGMRDLVKRLQPDCFEDIVALVALFRPGPLQSGMVDDFIQRKKNERRGEAGKVDYLHPSLESVLKPTYGVILYQEQVMQIAQILSGYTLGSADMLRRAMGKKQPEVMARMRSSFVEGAVANGVQSSEAGHIFDLIEKFAGYGFNKSHSVAYALLSYQTAWLKARYPAAFMCAALSTDMDNIDRVVTLIDECLNMGLTIHPPDVNASYLPFTAAADSAIQYGLGAIKGVGEAALTQVLDEREKNGPYLDLDDFCMRIDSGRVNKRVMEALVRSGGMDRLGPNRATLMQRLPDAVRVAEQHQRDLLARQDDLFGVPGSDITSTTSQSKGPIVSEWCEAERLNAERETLGLYLTGHPIDRYLDELSQFTRGRIAAVCGKVESTSGRRQKRDIDTIVAGLVIEVRSKNLSGGGKMGFITLSDHSARLDIVIGPELYESSSTLLVKDNVLVVIGGLGRDNFSGGCRVHARQLMNIDTARRRYARQLEVEIDSASLDDNFLDKFQTAVTPYTGGQCPLVVKYRNATARATLTLGENWRIKPCGELLDKLDSLHEKCDVRLIY